MKKFKLDANKEQRDTIKMFGKDENLDKKYNFFYDETNNFRKFALADDGFNNSIESNFILGGVMYFGDTFNGDVNKLKKEIKLQKTAKEIKFKHLAEKGSDFFECLNSNNVYIFLKWLSETDLYIHYSNINNFYYSLVDIIDSIYDIDYNYSLALEMKNELYIYAIKHYKDFFKLLKTYNYPNIKAEEISDFCDGMIQMLSCERNHNFILDSLIQLLKEAKKKDELIFLQQNKEATTIDNYSLFYLRPIMLFKNSMHIFDEELVIQEELKDIELYDNNNIMKNYDFLNSQSNDLIQISDCIVGLLGKYYNYINKTIDGNIEELDNLTEKQKDTLLLFEKLIFKSLNKSKYYLHSSISLYEHRVHEKILEWANLYEKKKVINQYFEYRESKNKKE